MNQRKELNAASAIIVIVFIQIHYPDLFVDIGKVSKR